MLWRHRCSLLLYYQPVRAWILLVGFGALIGCGAPGNGRMQSHDGDLKQARASSQDSQPANAWTLDLQPTFLADDYQVQLIEPCVVWLIDPTTLEEVEVYLDEVYYLPTSSWKVELKPSCGDITVQNTHADSSNDENQTDESSEPSADSQDDTSEDEEVAEDRVVDDDPRAVGEDPRKGGKRYD